MFKEFETIDQGLAAVCKDEHVNPTLKNNVAYQYRTVSNFNKRFRVKKNAFDRMNNRRLPDCSCNLDFHFNLKTLFSFLVRVRKTKSNKHCHQPPCL